MQTHNVLNLFPIEKPATPFDTFWQLYPRRVAKKDAEKMWARLTNSDIRAAIKALPDHIKYWRQAGRTVETIPHAATWLNGRRFEDELPADTPSRVTNTATRVTELTLAKPCQRCNGSTANGKTLRLAKWVCPACETAYQNGEWERVTT